MNKQLTEIAYILDRSGSMEPMAEPAITGFNEFLAEQRKAPGQARLTLVLFDDEYLVPCRGIPLSEVAELNAATYVPRGMTALLDAIGRTIDELGRKLAATPEPERPGKVIVAIFTDGMENASSDFSLQKISKVIKHQKDKYGWEFLFLGANQDAIATAAQIGIDRDKAATVSYCRSGVLSSSSSFNRKMSAMRHSAMTGEENLDYRAAMQDIVDEEKKKFAAE